MLGQHRTSSGGRWWHTRERREDTGVLKDIDSRSRASGARSSGSGGSGPPLPACTSWKCRIGRRLSYSWRSSAVPLSTESTRSPPVPPRVGLRRDVHRYGCRSTWGLGRFRLQRSPRLPFEAGRRRGRVPGTSRVSVESPALSTAPPSPPTRFCNAVAPRVCLLTPKDSKTSLTYSVSIDPAHRLALAEAPIRLVAKRRCYGFASASDEGEVLLPLTEETGRSVVVCMEDLVSAGEIDAIAICLLFSLRERPHTSNFWAVASVEPLPDTPVSACRAR